jgi:hypothetical protein
MGMLSFMIQNLSDEICAPIRHLQNRVSSCFAQKNSEHRPRRPFFGANTLRTGSGHYSQDPKCRTTTVRQNRLPWSAPRFSVHSRFRHLQYCCETNFDIAMDPLTALSLTGTIVQFVDFGSKLLVECHQLYKSKSGSLTANDELSLATEDLRMVVDKLQQSSPEAHFSPLNSSTSEEPERLVTFPRICAESKLLAQELLERLENLKTTKTEGRLWRSLQQVLRISWSRNEISGLEKRLSRLRDALGTNILVLLRFV